jgi:hypothetical protein
VATITVGLFIGTRRVGAATAASAVALAAAGSAIAAAPQPISFDPFTNPAAQHQTAVEPDSVSYGDTVVAAFQVGRFFGGGASGIGYATSTDEGRTWTSGILPGVTSLTTPAGEFDRASDPNVAYDAAHGRWLISVLAIKQGSPNDHSAVLVKTSADGLDWSAPAIAAAPATGAFSHDKNWAVCDNGVASPFRGWCYVSYTDLTGNGRVVTRRSLDGGATWSDAVASTDTTVQGLGAIPVVRPNGALVIPYLGEDGDLAAVRSTDGGATFGQRLSIAPVLAHRPAGMRAPTLPSADVDSGGKVYVAWHDCRFRSGCPDSPNDIVYSTSADGLEWSAPTRVPIEAVSSTVDHFIPGFAVDPLTQGSRARIGLAYYFSPATSCTPETCRLNAGYLASGDGGATWTAPEFLAAEPMALSSIADTSQGRMVGDYISTSFAPGGQAVAVLSLAAPFGPAFRQSIFAASFQPPPVPAGAVASPTTPRKIVTIGASRRIVVYSGRVTLFGTISSRRARETVQIVRRFRVLTRKDGSWLRVIRPRISGRFQARWSGVLSRTIVIRVRPKVELRVRGGLLEVRVAAVRSYAGRNAALQRRSGRTWRTVRTVRLGGASRALFDPGLPVGTRVRVVLPRRVAGPGYLAGLSRELVISAG